MADAIIHRGPDDDGYLEQPGIGLANRRLSIVGLADGKQPSTTRIARSPPSSTANSSIIRKSKQQLEAKGHRFATHCDTELIPHLWEDHQEDMFAICAASSRWHASIERRRRLILARDRFGICPLFWTRRTAATAIGSCSPRKSRPCSPPAWCPPGPTCAASIRCSISSRSPASRPASKGSTRSAPGRYLKINLGQMARQPR